MKKKIKLSKRFKKIIIPIVAASILTSCTNVARIDQNSQQEIDISNTSVETVINDVSRIEVADKVVIDDTYKNLDELRKYKEINYLKFENSHIKDFSELKNIDINMLQIIRNEYDFDLSNINCESIEQIYIKQTDVNNTKYLKDFEKLNALHIFESNIDDVTNINGCKKLEKLELDSVNVEDLKFLNGMNNLVSLNVSNTRLKSIKGLEGAKKLLDVELKSNMIETIDGIENKKIKLLNLDNNYIQDISDIKNLPELSTIYLRDNYIEDISVLSNKGYDRVELKNNNIKSLPKGMLLKGNMLDLSSNLISDIDENELLNSELNYINIFDNKFSNEQLESLKDCEQIVYKVDDKTYLTYEQNLRYNEEVTKMKKNAIENTDNKKNIISDLYKFLTVTTIVDGTVSNPNSNNKYGVVVDKMGLCVGYSETMQSVLKDYGIKTKRLDCDIGELYDTLPNGNLLRHRAFVAETEDGWRIYDVTNDINMNNLKNFGISKEEFVDKRGSYIMSNNIPNLKKSFDKEYINKNFESYCTYINGKMLNFEKGSIEER